MPLSQAVFLCLSTPNSGRFQGLLSHVPSSLPFLSFPVLLQPLFPTPFSSDGPLCFSDVSSAFLWGSSLPFLTSCVTLSPLPCQAVFSYPMHLLGPCWTCSCCPVPASPLESNQHSHSRCFVLTLGSENLGAAAVLSFFGTSSVFYIFILHFRSTLVICRFSLLFCLSYWTEKDVYFLIRWQTSGVSSLNYPLHFFKSFLPSTS